MKANQGFLSSQLNNVKRLSHQNQPALHQRVATVAVPKRLCGLWQILAPHQNGTMTSIWPRVCTKCRAAGRRTQPAVERVDYLHAAAREREQWKPAKTGISLEEGEGEKLVIVIEYLHGRGVAQTGCARLRESTVVIDLAEIIDTQGRDEAGGEKC